MKIFAILAFVLTTLVLTNGVSVEEDLTITSGQRIVLEKFRNLMKSRLPHEYMLQDIYLIRWLRASEFDIKEAESQLLDNLKWRKEMKMDGIMDEDWSEYESQYPYFLEGCDLEGRPVATVYVGEWDVRKAMISGERAKMYRYSVKLLEEITTLIRWAQDDGQNVTQFATILNMDSFNMALNGCPLCIPLYISMLTAYEQYYPGSLHKTILVNTPQIFNTLLNTILPFMPKRTRDLIFVYGRNKASWQSKLNSYISKDQLTSEFGGVKESAFTTEFLRKARRLPC